MSVIRSLGALLLAAVSGMASADNTLTEAEVAAGWRLLFDGSDLSAWRTYQRADVSSQWAARDGTLTLTRGGGGDLITRDQYVDFELVLDWKISAGGNSGIFILADETPSRIYLHAPEIQILDNERHRDNKLASHRAGSLYDMVAAPAAAYRVAGEWNRTRVALLKRRLSVWHNGLPVTDLVLGSDAWNALIADSKFADWQGFGANPGGHIGLQDHGDAVFFKNIKIRVLEP